MQKTIDIPYQQHRIMNQTTRSVSTKVTDLGNLGRLSVQTLALGLQVFLTVIVLKRTHRIPSDTIRSRANMNPKPTVILTNINHNRQKHRDVWGWLNQVCFRLLGLPIPISQRDSHYTSISATTLPDDNNIANLTILSSPTRLMQTATDVFSAMYTIAGQDCQSTTLTLINQDEEWRSISV